METDIQKRNSKLLLFRGITGKISTIFQVQHYRQLPAKIVIIRKYNNPLLNNYQRISLELIRSIIIYELKEREKKTFLEKVFTREPYKKTNQIKK